MIPAAVPTLFNKTLEKPGKCVKMSPNSETGRCCDKGGAPCRSLFASYLLMDKITSRKNPTIAHVRALANDGAYRREKGQYLCDGMKTLREALSFGARVCLVLWKEQAREVEGLDCREQYILPAELFDYASTMKNSPGPLFAVAIPEKRAEGPVSNAVILENVQDPGNVGTVIRTANAFGIGAVLLVGACADLYNPKTVRSTMGAIFRQRVEQMELGQLKAFLSENRLPLYGAALSDKARDVRETALCRSAVAIGSEGQGLSKDFLALCDGQIIIPMQPDSESLNAAAAASVLMWEMAR